MSGAVAVAPSTPPAGTSVASTAAAATTGSPSTHTHRSRRGGGAGGRASSGSGSRTGHHSSVSESLAFISPSLQSCSAMDKSIEVLSSAIDHWPLVPHAETLPSNGVIPHDKWCNLYEHTQRMTGLVTRLSALIEELSPLPPVPEPATPTATAPTAQPATGAAAANATNDPAIAGVAADGSAAVVSPTADSATAAAAVTTTATSAIAEPAATSAAGVAGGATTTTTTTLAADGGNTITLSFGGTAATASASASGDPPQSGALPPATDASAANASAADAGATAAVDVKSAPDTAATAAATAASPVSPTARVELDPAVAAAKRAELEQLAGAIVRGIRLIAHSMLTLCPATGSVLSGVSTNAAAVEVALKNVPGLSESLITNLFVKFALAVDDANPILAAVFSEQLRVQRAAAPPPPPPPPVIRSPLEQLQASRSPTPLYMLRGTTRIMGTIPTSPPTNRSPTPAATGAGAAAAAAVGRSPSQFGTRSPVPTQHAAAASGVSPHAKVSFAASPAHKTNSPMPTATPV